MDKPSDPGVRYTVKYSGSLSTGKSRSLRRRHKSIQGVYMSLLRRYKSIQGVCVSLETSTSNHDSSEMSQVYTRCIHVSTETSTSNPGNPGLFGDLTSLYKVYTCLFGDSKVYTSQTMSLLRPHKSIQGIYMSLWRHHKSIQGAYKSLLRRYTSIQGVTCLFGDVTRLYKV